MTLSLSKQEEQRRSPLSRQNRHIDLHFACDTWLDRIPSAVAGERLGYIPDQATVGELGQAMRVAPEMWKKKPYLSNDRAFPLIRFFIFAE